MPSRPRQPSPWDFDPRDLPPPEILAQAPWLEGLEHNVVFRALLHRRRIPVRRQLVLSALFFLSLALATVAYNADLPTPYLIAIPLGVSFFTFPSLQRLFGLEPVQLAAPALSPALILDLCRANSSEEEFAAGIWGAAISRRTLRRLRLNAATACAVSILSLGCGVPVISSAWVAAMFLALAFVGGQSLGFISANPCRAAQDVALGITASLVAPLGFTKEEGERDPAIALAVNVKNWVEGPTFGSIYLLIFSLFVTGIPCLIIGELSAAYHPMSPPWAVAGILSVAAGYWDGRLRVRIFSVDFGKEFVTHRDVARAILGAQEKWLAMVKRP